MFPAAEINAGNDIPTTWMLSDSSFTIYENNCNLSK